MKKKRPGLGTRPLTAASLSSVGRQVAYGIPGDSSCPRLSPEVLFAVCTLT